MPPSPDIYIVGATRTAIGAFGGALKDFAPADLGALVIAEAIERARVSPRDIGHVVMGNVIPSGPGDAYIARVSALKAGVGVETPALTVNRLCGSGLQAIVSAAQMMKLGEAAITVAGGAESMSQSPYVSKGMRWGTKMGDGAMIDALTGSLTDPVHGIHMGITAENVAAERRISREEQDALAVEGHRRAWRAVADGRFKEQIFPVEIKTRKGITVFDTDEHVRANVDIDAMAAMKPVFKTDGTVTAANSSGINDGAAAVVLATGDEVAARGLKPLTRIVAWGHAGVEPTLMGLGPVKAVPIALERAGLHLDQIDVIEANEAFAAQACAVAKDLGFDSAKLNPNGSGIALGHPIGATGAILTVKTVYELRRTGGQYGLVTMCIGGGQGIAMILERT